jgi:hypothetical protein
VSRVSPTGQRGQRVGLVCRPQGLKDAELRRHLGAAVVAAEESGAGLGAAREESEEGVLKVRLPTERVRAGRCGRGRRGAARSEEGQSRRGGREGGMGRVHGWD